MFIHFLNSKPSKSFFILIFVFVFVYRVFEIFGPSILGKLCEEEIEVLVQSVFPDEMLKRVVSLDDYAKTLVVQEGVDNQI